MIFHGNRRGPRTSSLALAIAGLLACGSKTSVDAYVDASAKDICDAVLACNCEYPNGALYEHCLGELTVFLDSTAQLNLVDGLSFDGDCADEAATALKELACGVNQGDPDAACEAPCKLWYGPVGKGATCTTVNGSDNCKQGLVCGADSVCVDPCAEPKVPALGEVCGQLLGCVEGAYCDTESPDLNPICKALPGAGEPCTTGEFCAEDLFCDTSVPGKKICTALPGLGAECIDFQCAADLYCDPMQLPNVCAAVPTLGEACDFGACQAPYVCSDNDVCTEPPPQVCGLYGGLPREDCNANEFTCNSGACIDIALVCDGTPQCNDDSDEAPINPLCAIPCEVDEYTCDDGACIPAALECDDFPDCSDASDELTCP